MGCISVEMWRARIGGFSSSSHGMKRAHRLRINSSYKKGSIIIVLILCCVCLTSSNPWISRKQHNTTNNFYINENSTPGTSNGTTIHFSTKPLFNTTTAPPTAEENFFDTASTIIYFYLLSLSLLIWFNFWFIDGLSTISMFKKGSWVILNEWIDYFKYVTFTFSNMNVMLFPITMIGMVLPMNSLPEIVFRYIVDIGLLLSKTLYLMCITIRLIVSPMSVCMDTTNFKTHLSTFFKMTGEKIEKVSEIMFRLIIVLIRAVIKLLLSPISVINNMFQSEYIRPDGELEGTIKAKILFWYSFVVKALKILSPMIISFMQSVLVDFQNRRNLGIWIVDALLLGAIIVLFAIIFIITSHLIIQKKTMKTIPNGDFYNGLPDVDPDHCKRLQSVLASITNNSASFYMARHDKASDSLCKCRLRLGSSDKYKRIVKRNKASGAQTNNSPENVFVDSKQKQLLKKVESEEKRNYESIINGKEKELVVSPSLFQFNSKIGVHETIEQHTLQDIAHKIKNQNPSCSEQDGCDSV